MPRRPVRWLVGQARRLRYEVTGPEVTSERDTARTESGRKVGLTVFRVPDWQGPHPGVLLVPGLGEPADVFTRWTSPVHGADLASLGCVVAAVDLAGRGRSEGVESWGGPTNHRDVVAALDALAARSDVRSDRLGIVSFSLGVAAVAGALALPRPDVQWWIDWEGPSDRDVITAGGKMLAPADGHGLDDDLYWHPREAVRTVGTTGVPYLRYQAGRDHAQPGETRHATRMIEAAAAGALPWFQLNDHARSEVPESPTWMPAGHRAARRWIVARVRELTQLP